MLALTSATGKLGGATLSAILSHNLIPPTQLVICTSSDISSPQFSTYKNQGIQIRPFNFESPQASTFEGCTKLFLVSTPNISLDFKGGPGRESVHIPTIRAAISAGVREVVFTSLAFGCQSEAGVMRAHLRTEEFLKECKERGECDYTIIREGLYNESWPLYLGYFDAGKDERKEVLVAGDGKISWTSIKDLGLGTALVLADGSGRWRGKTFYLSNDWESFSLKDVAGMVGHVLGRAIGVKVVGREEYVDFYVKEGKERAGLEWWGSTYAALEKGECDVKDGTLAELVKEKGVVLKSVEESITEMLS